MSQVTKRALAASLIKLLSQKPLDKVTVKDIIEDCGVNRQTFYYHLKIFMTLWIGYFWKWLPNFLRARKRMIRGSRDLRRYFMACSETAGSL